MDRIGDTGLAVGDYHSALASSERFDTVVNVSKRRIVKDNLLHIPLDDHRTQQRQFDHAADTVLERLEAGDSVLLHCKIGVNRSPSVAMAALGSMQDLSFDEAHELVLSHRTVASPTDRNLDLVRAYLDDTSVDPVGEHQSTPVLRLTGLDTRIRRFLWKLVN